MSPAGGLVPSFVSRRACPQGQREQSAQITWATSGGAGMVTAATCSVVRVVRRAVARRAGTCVVAPPRNIVTETHGESSAERLMTCRLWKVAVACVATPLATRIALRRGRLAACLSPGRAAQVPPLRRCAPHCLATKPGAPAGRTGRC
jgi:hypothetical protein